MPSQTPFRTTQSYLTGRTIYVNSSAEFAVPPTFTVEGMRRFAEVVAQHIRDTPTKTRHSLALRKHLAELSEISTPEQLLTLVQRLLAYVSEQPDPHDVVHTREVLRKLWHFDLLAWPLLPNEQAIAFKLTKKWLWEPERKELLEKLASLDGNKHTASERTRGVMTLVMASAGSRDIGDFTPEVAGDYFFSVLKPTTIRLKTVLDMVTLQYMRYGSQVKHVAKDYGSFGRLQVRFDDKFQWALSKDPTLRDWVEMASLFMETIHKNRTLYRSTFNAYLFDFLIENPAVTRVPEEYLRRDYVSPVPLQTNSPSNESVMYYLFEFILETRCTAEDDHGYKVRLPGYHNPIEVRSQRKRPAETHREAMPTRFVRMLQDILVADNYAWPKKFGEARWNGKGGDTFMWPNPETGSLESVWSPVRTIALLIKLLLPARTFQVRMLDSGEADTIEYQLDTNTWVANVGHLAPPKGKRVTKGVFARQKDKDGQEYVFLRFNTNKTTDQNNEGTEPGYVMPWQHVEVIRLLSFLRDWQKKYNSIYVPTRWCDIKDVGLSGRYSKDALEAKGSSCFLFRDPCLPHRDQPVTDARLNTMWRNLNLELERRLAEAGETMPDGSPIVLVEKTVVGRPVYDLHTLRVTLITALAESGGVPPSVLMKVVGHASVIMTLYYMKLSPAHICEQLNKAELKIHNQEQMNWQAWLTNQTRETLVSAVAYTSSTALEAMAKGTATSWVIRDHGICPVGCTRCHEGGEAVVDTKAYHKWGPVQGGASNCVRCRFFITGPAFLLGLQAYFDNIGYQLKESSKRYQAAKAKFEAMEAGYIAKQVSGVPITKQETQKLTVASSHFDQRTIEVDNLAHSWHATYSLIQQCLHIIRTNKDKPATENHQYALVTAGGLANVEVVLEQSSEFEQIDRICQSAIFFEGIDSTTPNLKRMRAFDAMLKRNGLNPIFIELDEQTALEAGNQMAAFMYARFGRESTDALMAGRETLRRLGIEAEVIRQLETMIPLRLTQVLNTPQAALRAPVNDEGDVV
ncbi:gamma-mobile-trio integrase GmtZ [Comamonas jiangduensis]|uniref:VPA1269 family protein n=1 Tax=Comamonas jiangduensis TaxID=1194168 RepID=A0ABV4I825_9BURK